MVGLVLGTVLCFAVFCKLLEKPYLRRMTARKGTARTAYHARKARPVSLRQALLRRELLHLGSSSAYMLNSAMGTLGLLVLGGVSLWKTDLFARFAQAVPEGVPVLVCCAVCAVSAANFLTTPSVSLEGRTVWLLQCLRIPSWQGVCAKLELLLLLSGVAGGFCLVCMQAAVQMQVLYSSLQVAADGAPAALLLTEECTRATVAVQLLPPFVWEDPLPPLPDTPAALTLQLTMQDVMQADTDPAALGRKLAGTAANKRWLHHPKAETFLAERVALLQRVYKR